MWIAGLISLGIVLFLVFLILFEPALEYQVKAPGVALDSDQYLRLLAALADAQVHGRSHIEVLLNGDKFYEAELAAIRDAKSTINLEAYIFYRGEIASRMLEALTERARAGVKVKLIIDYIGSFSTWNSTFKDLRDAGGQVVWYQPIRWYTFKRFNNRTHRELLIVDGKVGFIGGAGIADFWFKSTQKTPLWRDTMFRVTGDLLIGLQTTFAENWLEAADEILARPEYFPACADPASDDGGDGEAGMRGIVVISAPSAGRATRARVVFQTLLASATQTIDIVSPYFLPDRSTRREFCRAARDGGVRVRVIAPGERADHTMTRRASRRRYGDLLKSGVEIHEYQPSMIHEKLLVVDRIWCVVGSTNFDSRSFGLNDEVNLAVMDRAFAAQVLEDYEHDLSSSHRVTLEEWNRRPITERLGEWLSRIIERQQ
jgi:cardiolipin synthase